jgi:hypothetical protein
MTIGRKIFNAMIIKPGIYFFSTVTAVKPSSIGCARHAGNEPGFNEAL